LKSNKPLKIYLGDLTYDTVTLATEAMPLNIGFAASYCIKKFGSNVDITLFKYIEELDAAIHNSPPDILGLSNYCWSHNVSLEIFKMLRKVKPDALTIMGGPNFPIDFPSQGKFMKKHSQIDFYVPVDGEEGFSNIVGQALNSTREKMREEVLESEVDGCVSLDPNGKLKYTIPVLRIKKLDEIPSPYTTGLMDKFFDGKLTPMLQTNRGCPFKCTFCTDGKDEVNKVNSFSTQRVKEELDYMVKMIPENTHNLLISDLNFGMYPRDQETCDFIAEHQTKHDFPHFILVSTGKNQKEKIIKAINKLSSSIRLVMSVQSMDQEVLTNIKRDNISVDQMMQLAPAIKDAKLLTRSEVISGLPGDTYEIEINTLRDLVHAKMDEIQVHTCMLLDGSEMATPAERKKWKFITRFRVLQRDFAELSNGKKVVEVEEVVVGNDKMTIDEYIQIRILAFIIYVTGRGIVYDPILKLLREHEIDIFDFYLRIKDSLDTAPELIQDLFNRFEQSSRNELWNSKEEILKYYQENKNYQKLLDGEDGINVMYHYLAEVTAENMDSWGDYILRIAKNLLQELKENSMDIDEEFLQISNYCHGVSHNTMGVDRMSTNPEFEFSYDIISWLEDSNEAHLSKFKLQQLMKISFQLTDEQFKSIQDTIEMFGNTKVGRSKAMRMIAVETLWRRAIKLVKNNLENPIVQ
jgi:radical SAM superfamily enzyme YgiQ (UPF0313 family)